jgi:hypothetical protein
MLNELRQEAATTKRLLERMPGDKLSWTPHPKSMCLGQLALHVAPIPGDLGRLARLDEFDAAEADSFYPVPASREEIQVWKSPPRENSQETPHDLWPLGRHRDRRHNPLSSCGRNPLIIPFLDLPRKLTVQ